MAELEDRHLVVTGGTGALGVAVVRALVARGAHVHVPALEVSHADGFALRDHPRVRVAAPVELTDEGSVARFYGEIPALWGSVHLAGAFAMRPVAETSAADLRAMLEVNVVTAFLCAREAVGAIRRRGDGEGGRIVNVTARPAVVPTGGLAAYAAAKAAVAALTLSLAEELAGERIWVNAVVPSIFDTPANRAAMPDADHARWPSPDALAETIAFLASPANAATRGGLVPVYGRS